jgi:hypothetical protein
MQEASMTTKVPSLDDPLQPTFDVLRALGSKASVNELLCRICAL